MNEIEKIEKSAIASAEQTPMAMIEKALASGASVETIGQLMALQERWEANQARAAFVEAMNAFKRNPPSVFKNAEVDFTSPKGRTHYKHASLDNVCNVLGDCLAQHGLSFRWETENMDQGLVRVTCVLTHSLGHSERVVLQAASDQSGGKNSIQAVGSTVTYLQRYTLLAATGIAVQGQDDDGRAGHGQDEAITDEQQEEIKARILSELDAGSRHRFFAWLRVNGVAEIRKADYARAIRQLDRKKADAGNENP